MRTRTVDISAPELRLLGGFSLRVGDRPVAIPMHSRRVLAYLCLDHGQDHGCDRGVLAERLWPDSDTDHARASLRTALWRIRRASDRLVQVQPDAVALGREVGVDVHRFRHVAEQLMSGRADDGTDATRVVARSTELLPGWDEPWLVLAREQLRQARLHALEASASRLRRARRFPEAIDAMLGVIAEEPLRESAHAALIGVYLSEGNASEAIRHFDGFAALLWHELGLRPSDALCELVGLGPAPTPRQTVRSQVRPRVPAQTARRSA